MNSTRAGLLLLAAAGLRAQSIQVDVPASAPISIDAPDWGQSRVSARAGAVLIELRTSLSMKNVSNLRIRAVTLLVSAAEMTAGGRASVTLPSLDAGPGETFAARLDMRLLRPGAGAGQPVKVSIDGVLYDTLGFYGPDKLQSRRSMTAWELEARRDRRVFREALRKGGPDELRRTILASINRQDSLPRLDVHLARLGPGAAVSGQPISVSGIELAGAPLEVVSGSASVSEREIRLPKVEIRSRAAQPIRYVELSWLARDAAGREMPIGTLPAQVSLGSGASSRVEEAVAMRLGVQPLSLRSYPSLVEFADGSLWVPAQAVGGISPEEQRLSEIYRRKGLEALVAEIGKLQ